MSLPLLGYGIWQRWREFTDMINIPYQLIRLRYTRWAWLNRVKNLKRGPGSFCVERERDSPASLEKENSHAMKCWWHGHMTGNCKQPLGPEGSPLLSASRNTGPSGPQLHGDKFCPKHEGVQKRSFPQPSLCWDLNPSPHLDFNQVKPLSRESREAVSELQPHANCEIIKIVLRCEVGVIILCNNGKAKKLSKINISS